MTNSSGNSGATSYPAMMVAHLAGVLPDDGVHALDRAMSGRAELRREFAGLLLQQVMLSEIGREATRKPEVGAARPGVLRSRTFWISAAAAAVLMLALGTWLVLRPPEPAPAAPAYPGPQIAGAATVLGGGAPARGSTVSTAAEPGTLTLGGYCKVDMHPGSVVAVKGEERREQIVLDRGKVVCRVDREVGTFVVDTRIGSVSVRGTEFSVEMADRKGEGPMLKKGALVMLVAVMLGGVDVTVGGKTVTLAAGRSRVFAAEQGDTGTVTGVVTGKERNWIAVRADGEQEAKRYMPAWVGGMPDKGGGLDKSMIEKIAMVKVGTRVRVTWKQDEHLRVTELEVLTESKRTE